MRKLALALAAASFLAAPAVAAPGQGKGKAYGHDTKVCLIGFNTAEEAQAGADATVIKAQYLPLRIALTKAEGDASQAIGFYGPTTLSADDLTLIGATTLYNYPDGIGTEEQCEAYMDIAEQNSVDDDAE
jgi:hypothetical protein